MSISGSRTALLIALSLLLCLGLSAPVVGQGPAAADQAPSPSIALPKAALVGYPLVVAPGGRIPLRWELTGGASASQTYILWDTTSHDHDNAYANHTTARSGAMGFYTDYLNVPAGAVTLYCKAYAVIGGTPVYGDREHALGTRYALNVGGNQWGLDAAGDYWNPDRAADMADSWYRFEGGEMITLTHPIANTTDDWIYQTERRGLTSFAGWLGSGVYQGQVQVEFHLAELEATGAGQRVFNIFIEKDTPNEVALRDIDVWARAGGADRAVVLTTTVQVNSVPGMDEALNITFSSTTGHAPILNGLVLRGLSAIPQYEVARAVGAGADDTYTDESGGHLDATRLRLGGNSQYHGGFRFPALQVPRDAAIHYADLQLVASEDAYMNTRLRAYAHAADSSPAFNVQAIVPNRPRSTASALWDLPGTEWRVGHAYHLTGLDAVVQEIISRAGWQQGNALSLLLIAEQGDVAAPRVVYAFEGSDVNRALLRFYYTPRDLMPSITPTPSATPTVTPTATPTATATLQPRYWIPLVVKG